MLRIEPKPMAWFGPTWFSQMRSPVAAFSACTMFMVLARYMMPLCTSGLVWLAPPSFIDHDQARRRSLTFARVISASGLWLQAW